MVSKIFGHDFVSEVSLPYLIIFVNKHVNDDYLSDNYDTGV